MNSLDSLQPPSPAANLPKHNEMIEFGSYKIEVRSDQNPKYKKIELSLINWVGRTVLIICTAGVARDVLDTIFYSALKKGNTKIAELAVKWGASDFLTSKQLIKLEKSKKIESLKFLLAQVDFDKSTPDGGSSAAYNFIRARDDFSSSEKPTDIQHPAFLAIFDNDTMPHVYFYVMKRFINWGDHHERHETTYCGLKPKTKEPELEYNSADLGSKDLSFDVPSTDENAIQIYRTKII